MKTPCIAACKNSDGICSGCHRTMAEIIGWKEYSDTEREAIMKQITSVSHTHQCPSCGEGAHCDISAGKSTCWCFEVEERNTSKVSDNQSCVCRKCLTALPTI
ncbi:DUF1289 domain-containing protein [Vibrio genomosp. F6]|uniref:cysteine-rich CWC family protein n=1 Tax=Vibrio TaxID=662 RepID=UPI0010BD0AA8|nr:MULTISPECIES: cysteine-rich CWC family protein [Vibrio]NOH82787.1 DUF1289 domain-containing protein [Vibrio sp. 03-59-1]TKF21044.1 DUF1289 domain-containing protein [Vibrio genomosp. F6]